MRRFARIWAATRGIARAGDVRAHALCERRVRLVEVRLGVEVVEVVRRVALRPLRFRAPEELLVDHGRQIVALEARGLAQLRAVEPRYLTARALQTRDLRLQRGRTVVRQLPVVLVPARRDGEGRVGGEMSLEKPVDEA